jgi:hypothetical protein
MTPMRTDVFVYLSGPITAKAGYSVEQNVAAAVKVYFALLARGIPCFCPHLSGAFPSAFGVDYETWLAYDFAVIARCTHVLLLDRWDTSTGAVREREFAESIGVPVVNNVEDL